MKIQGFRTNIMNIRHFRVVLKMYESLNRFFPKLKLRKKKLPFGFRAIGRNPSGSSTWQDGVKLGHCAFQQLGLHTVA